MAVALAVQHGHLAAREIDTVKAGLHGRMKLRLEPSDEHMHPLESAKNFNESMYFNFFDPADRVGGWFRLGNRANEGYAEMTTCVYLPDGRVGFMFSRPEIAD